MLPKISLIASLFFLLTACNLTDKGNDKAIIEGIIVNTSRDNAPIPHLNVALKEAGGSWFYPVVASTRTNEEGEFYLEYEFDDQDVVLLYVNDEPYIPLYSTYNASIYQGESLNKTIELYENTSLVARASTGSLQEGDRYCINVPLKGVCEDEEPTAEVSTTRAVGNAYNQVRFSLERNGTTEVIIDSVFCPTGETTEYEFEF